ncbi:DUF3460 family protein [Paraherbaspirillum soli]|uniref:DUF3460 family protein n=1 Tax=Paraherbaspirillum soli TaxID=631222 RepID=A0ABW0MA02_9BURK
MKHHIRYLHYASEFSKFLEELKQQHPEIEEHQREGFALLWDRPPLDLEEQERANASEVKPKAYVYA